MLIMKVSHYGCFKGPLGHRRRRRWRKKSPPLAELILRVVGQGSCQPFFGWRAFPFPAFPWFPFVFQGFSSYLLVGGRLKTVGRGPAQPP